ncbi:unnamed protein product [Brassica rapa subsp. trilocularis]
MSGWPSGLRRQTQVLVFERGRGPALSFYKSLAAKPMRPSNPFLHVTCTQLCCLSLTTHIAQVNIHSGLDTFSSFEKSDRYINRHIVSDDRRKFQTIDYLKETFHDELANIFKCLSRY